MAGIGKTGIGAPEPALQNLVFQPSRDLGVRFPTLDSPTVIPDFGSPAKRHLKGVAFVQRPCKEAMGRAEYLAGPEQGQVAPTP